MERNKIVKLVAAVLICEIAGGIGSLFTSPSIPTWYASIQKPDFTPPNWVFAPVWVSLFFLMGVSLYLVWDRGLERKDVKLAVCVFGIQFALNVIWSLLFFGLQNPFLAFIEIVFLWIAILVNIIFFYRITKAAGIILVPYILWVSVAALLNYGVWVLNP